MNGMCSASARVRSARVRFARSKALTNQVRRAPLTAAAFRDDEQRPRGDVASLGVRSAMSDSITGRSAGSIGTVRLSATEPFLSDRDERAFVCDDPDWRRHAQVAETQLGRTANDFRVAGVAPALLSLRWHLP